MSIQQRTKKASVFSIMSTYKDEKCKLYTRNIVLSKNDYTLQEAIKEAHKQAYSVDMIPSLPSNAELIFMSIGIEHAGNIQCYAP